MRKPRRISRLLAAVLIFAPLLLATDKQVSLKIDNRIEKYRLEIIKIRRFIHMNPELGNREFETANLVASKLMSLGIEVKTGVAKTGVVGLLHGEQDGPTVAIRADMDALPLDEKANVPYRSLNPGVMHACGHDIHTSIALGTAYVLNGMKDHIKGSIKFIFQPAEEGAPPGEKGGADVMIEEGVLENPPVKAIFGLHVSGNDLGTVAFAPGGIMASSDSFTATILGKSAHGALPHEGVDAIALAAQVIVSWQSIISRSLDQTDPAVITVGKIAGGQRRNIIADEVELEGTVRTLSQYNRERIPEQMEEVIRGITKAFGGDFKLDYRKGAPSVYNHPELAKVMLPTLQNVLGSRNVKTLIPQMVAEDFAFYGQNIPGFFFFLGAKNPSHRTFAPLHSPYFNPDERSIFVGVRLMCHLLLDCLEYQNRLEGDSPQKQ
jgi:amidohydrolase